MAFTSSLARSVMSPLVLNSVNTIIAKPHLQNNVNLHGHIDSCLSDKCYVASISVKFFFWFSYQLWYQLCY